MNTFKTAVVLATLLGVGYGVHVVLNRPLSNAYEQKSYEHSQTPLDEFGLPRLNIEGVPGVAESTGNITPFQPPQIVPSNGADNYQYGSADAPQNGYPNADNPANNLAGNDIGRSIDHASGMTPDAANQLTNVTSGTNANLAPASTVDSLPDLSLNEADFPELPDIRPESTTLTNDTPPNDPQPLAAHPTIAPPIESVQFSNPEPPTGGMETANVATVATPPTNELTRSPTIQDPTFPASALMASAGSQNGRAAIPNSAFNNMWQSAQEKVKDGEYDVALFTLSLWYSNPDLTSEQRNDLIPMLDELAGKVIYSRDYVFGRPHTVQPRETLAQIAAQNAVTPEFLARVNGLDSSAALTPGQQLKVITGPFRAELDLSKREITVFVGSYYAGRFMAGVGRDLPLGEMALKVFEKSGARPYVDRETNEQVVAGDPKNPYGNYWIGLHIPGAPIDPHLGIHATGSRVEASDTRGCISLSERDADDLQAILSIGSLFTVRR